MNNMHTMKHTFETFAKEMRERLENDESLYKPIDKQSLMDQNREIVDKAFEVIESLQNNRKNNT